MQSVTATGLSQVLFSKLFFSLTGAGAGYRWYVVHEHEYVGGLPSYMNFYCDRRAHCLQPDGPAFKVVLFVLSVQVRRVRVIYQQLRFNVFGPIK